MTSSASTPRSQNSTRTPRGAATGTASTPAPSKTRVTSVDVRAAERGELVHQPIALVGERELGVTGLRHVVAVHDEVHGGQREQPVERGRVVHPPRDALAGRRSADQVGRPRAGAAERELAAQPGDGAVEGLDEQGEPHLVGLARLAGGLPGDVGVGLGAFGVGPLGLGAGPLRVALLGEPGDLADELGLDPVHGGDRAFGRRPGRCAA